MVILLGLYSLLAEWYRSLLSIIAILSFSNFCHCITHVHYNWHIDPYFSLLYSTMWWIQLKTRHWWSKMNKGSVWSTCMWFHRIFDSMFTFFQLVGLCLKQWIHLHSQSCLFTAGCIIHLIDLSASGIVKSHLQYSHHRWPSYYSIHLRCFHFHQLGQHFAAVLG